MVADTSVLAGVTYWYRVVAVNGGGASGYSNTFEVTPAAAFVRHKGL